jgi:hypothetical protein
MKIWITRDTVGSIWSGGLERLRVWFTKPSWVERKVWEDLPFGHSPTMEEAHWEVVKRGKCERGNVSFGNVFGYTDTEDKDQNKLAQFVWDALCTHFHNQEPFEAWEALEKQGLATIKDFLLEVEVSIKMNDAR